MYLIVFAILLKMLKVKYLFFTKYLLCALAYMYIHYSMCNEMIVFEQWCYF